MEEKFVIKNITTGLYFTSSDWGGVYFDVDYIRYFNTHEEALNRLKEESSLFPLQFANLPFQIVPVYKFK